MHHYLYEKPSMIIEIHMQPSRWLRISSSQCYFLTSYNLIFGGLLVVLVTKLLCPLGVIGGQVCSPLWHE